MLYLQETLTYHQHFKIISNVQLVWNAKYPNRMGGSVNDLERQP